MVINLKYKITFFSVLSIVAISLSISSILLFRTKKEIRTEFNQRTMSITKNFALESELGVLVENKKILSDLLEDLFKEKDVVSAEIFNKEKNLLVKKQQKKSINKRQMHVVVYPILISMKDLNAIRGKDSTKGDAWFSDEEMFINDKSKEAAKNSLLDEGDLADIVTEEIGLVKIKFSTQNTDKVIYRITFIVVFVTAFFIIIGFLFSYFFSNTITSPVSELVRATEKISEGDLSYEITPKTKDEIGILTRSFNSMTKQLKHHMDELKKLTDGLDRKVKERTKELEEANVKLKEADKMKSEFLARMSHELRTPLNAILGFSGIMLSGVEGDINDTVKEDVKMIESSGKHLLGLINNILDLSKIEAGKMELHKEEISLKEVIDDVVSTAAALVGNKDVELRKEVGELPNIVADKVRIRQIFLNLISNALKFTEHGHVTIKSILKGKKIILSVEDTGIGIGRESIGKVFDEFTQLAGATGETKGTGLGMAITKKFVEMHGGRIWVESELGVGSTFWIILPIKSIKFEEMKYPHLSAQKDANNMKAIVDAAKTILVADDDKYIVSLYKKYLEAEGHTVITVSDGKEIVDKVKELIPDCVILDILMPHRTGWEIIEELKQIPETKDIPIIISSIIDEKNRGFALGAKAYLVKPVHKDELLFHLTRLTQKRARVLIIDDTKEDVIVLKKMLQEENYDVEQAYGGQEGLRLVSEFKPDLVLLDLMMPGTDGFTILEELQKNEDTKTIPVILVTGKEINYEDIAKFRDNVKDLLKKGTFTKDELVKDVLNIIKSNIRKV
jgi:signal transduction histidine kinase/DNA-binding response OmpR family regulator